MLKLKSEQDEGKYSVEQIRKRYKKKIREEELQSIFASIRKKLIEEQRNLNEPAEQIEHQIAPIPQQPLPPNYYQYLSYAMRMVPMQNHAIYQQMIKYPPPLAQEIQLPQIDHNIYFQKNGIIVYKNLIGQGTFAHVWEGKMKQTGQKIAVKEVRTLEENQRKCLKELQSQYVVKVIDIFKHLSKNFIILEFCDSNLIEELKSCNFQIQMALKYFEQLVLGMDVLQSKNIIHRDLKFENILVKGKKIKIADFGLAKCMGTELQVQSRRCGTPYTMAPQIFFSTTKYASYTIKSDIWSMGVILHEMLYKIHPFNRDVEDFRRDKRVRVARRYGILDKIIDECLIFNPLFRINWNEFRALFNYYLQEKKFYFAYKIQPTIRKPTQNEPKVLRKEENFKQDPRLIKDVKPRQRQRNRIKEKQQSRDRREDRTPSRRKKFSLEKDIIDKDKFQYPFQKEKRYRNNLRVNGDKKGQLDRKIQNKVVYSSNEKKIPPIDFQKQEQRPFNNENKLIPAERVKKPQQQQPRLRLFLEFIAILMVVVVVHYITFEW